LGYLRDYTFDGLKIDRSFIADIETNPQSRAFVRAIVDMVRALGVQATAEGVETEGQTRLLRDAVDLMQGYLLGPPMPPDCALSLIQRRAETERPALVAAEDAVPV
jgi:EAL domain-containing protein (putative c-di-GMP-specific phosphodiesterase class I)